MMTMMSSSHYILVTLLCLQMIFDTLCHTEVDSSAPPATFKYYIFSNECYDTFFVNNDWLNVDCLKKSIAKVLGYAVVAGAAIVKLPQIIKIIQKKSVYGVSFQSVLFESFTQICSVAYNIYRKNPFSVYGQTLLITVQMVIIHLLFLVFDGKKRTIYGITLIPVLIVFWASFNPEYFPTYILEDTITVQIILFSGARLSQIYEIHKLKSTGSLSIITCGLTVLGNMARVATVLVEVKDDVKYLLSFAIALVLNTYILLCFFIFKEKPADKLKKEDVKKE